jgi:hypothetical protein
MRLKRFAILIPALTALSILASKPVPAQVPESPKYRKWLDCTVSEFRGFSSSCGIIKHYAYIFVGSIISIDQISDDEKRLQLQIHEIFLGNPTNELTVNTRQSNCLEEVRAGDEWLFYLYRDDTTKELLLAYGSPSGPVAKTEPTVALLRLLSRMTDSGVIRGYVQDTLLNRDDNGGTWTQYFNAPHRQIAAKSLSDGIEYSASSNSDGYYEFQSLPPGKYHITPNTTPGLWAEDGDTAVSPGSCTQINFALSTDGQLSGHVISPDGQPFAITPWVEIQSEDLHFSKSTPVNDQGYYELRGLPPGQYFVGIGINSQPDTPEWRSRIYYPGVRARKPATIIELREAEKRINVDFLSAPPDTKYSQPEFYKCHL